MALSLYAIAPTPLFAQQTGPAAPPSRGSEYENCSAEEQAAVISGEIVVCRRKADNDQHRLTSRENAQRRYAEETMHAGDPLAPDVAGPGIFRGPATAGGMCGIGLNKCPPPPAYMIDFSTLPDAPPGSDADRIAKGQVPE